jgi:hypothetical protein
VNSVEATISITVLPLNDAPLAISQSLETNEDTPLNILLTGSDIDGDEITFEVLTQPTSGTLSGTAPDLVYTPNADFVGTDSFTFVVNDGQVNSAAASISIAVSSTNLTGFNEWLAGFGLTASPQADSDNDNISNAVEYVIGGNPATRNDSALLPSVSLVSADPSNIGETNDYLLFSYRRTDLSNNNPQTTIQVQWSNSLTGTWNDAEATLGVIVIEENDGFGEGVDRVKVYIPRSLAVNGRLFARLWVDIDLSTPVNTAPVANAQSLETDEDVPLNILLSGSDFDADELTFEVITQPANGTLSGTAPELVYTPNADFYGTDSFTFVVNDGQVDSAEATISITVNGLEEFNQWMDQFGISGAPTDDSDLDGISNAVEYVIGGNPSVGSDQLFLPSASRFTGDPDGESGIGEYLVFSYRRTDIADTDPSTALRVEWSPSLAAPWNNADTTPGVITIELDDAAGAGVDVVNVYLPLSLAANGRLFTRLGVDITIP